MRTLLRAHIDAESGNQAIKDGTMPEMIETLVTRLKPEAAYFFPDRGRRSFLMVFDLADPSRLPVIAEPLFRNLKADVELVPVMNLDDLRQGLTEIAKER